MTQNHYEERIIELLKSHPEGLTILEISKKLNANRATVTKYIYKLYGAGKIKFRKVGPAKLCYLNKGVKTKVLILPFLLMLLIPGISFAQVLQSHPLSEITPIDMSLNMYGYNITNVSYIAIGTALPNYPLHVVGNAYFTGNLITESSLFFGTGGPRIYASGGMLYTSSPLVLGGNLDLANNLFLNALLGSNLNANNYNITNANYVYANYFVGSGKYLTDIPATSVQDVWVNESGDVMTGTLNMSGNNIVDVGSLYASFIYQNNNQVLDVATSFAGDVAGTYNNLQLQPGVVGTTELADNAVTSAKIADGTITNADIANNAGIAWSKLAGHPNIIAGPGLTGGGPISSDVTLQVAFGDNFLGWGNLTNYPAGCPAGQAVQVIGDTLTCIDISSNSNITGTGSAGQVAFWTGTSTLAGDNGLYWDNTNKRLGIGTTTPAYKLDIVGDIRLNATSAEKRIRFSTGLSNDIGFFGRPSDGAVGLYDWANNRGVWYYLPNSNILVIYRNTYFSSRVGIGTTTPAYTLDVIGDIRATGTIYGNLSGTASDLECVDCVTLGTETTGNYVADITAGTGISVSGTPGEGWSPTVSVVFGNTAGTAAEGNKQITISAGSGLTGGGTITIGAGGSVTLDVGAGTGIIVNADSIALNTTYLSNNYIDEGQAAGGDLAGSYPNPTVVGLQGRPVSNVAPANNQALVWNGTHWVPTSVDTSTNNELQNIWYTIAVPSGTNPQPDSTSDTLTLSAGAGITITGDASTDTITFAHADTSNQSSLDNAGGVVIQDVTIDNFGHVTGLATVDLDTRYYTKSLADSRFANVDQAETITGSWTFSNDVTFQKNIYVAGNISYVNAQTLNVNGSIIPPLDNWFDLGNSSNRWRNAYFAGTVYANAFEGSISANNVQDIWVNETGDTMTGTLTITAGGLQVTGGTVSLVNLNVDSGTLYVDAANNRVGIGTTTPAYTLDVAGTIRSTIDIRAPIFYDSDNTTYYIDPASTSNLNTIQLNDVNTKILEGNGNAIRIQTNSGYIDIGPQNTGWSHFNTDRPAFWFNKPVYLGTGILSSYSIYDLQLQTAGITRIFVERDNGNVGINTTTPAYTLDVVGIIRATDDMLLTENGTQIQFGSKSGTGYAKLYTLPTSNRLFVRAEGVDNVAQFASYGLYLPRDVGISLYVGGDIRLGYASGTDDDTIYFDAGDKYLKWSEANLRFEFSSDVYAPSFVGNLSGTASDLECVDCVTLGTETTGNYVATISGTAPISVSGGTGEASTPTVSLSYNVTHFTLTGNNLALASPYATGSAYDSRFVNEGQVNSISTSMIQDGAITNVKIAANAINSTQLQDNSVINSKIVSVDWIKLQNYPAGCPAGQAVQVIGDTLTCIDISSNSNITGTGSAGQVAFWTGTSTLAGDNGLYWDNTNKRLGIGTTTPAYTLDVAGTIRSTIDIRAPIFYDSDNTAYYVNPASTTYLNVLTTSGNVGIGTNNPLKRLDVNGETLFRTSNTTKVYFDSNYRSQIYWDQQNNRLVIKVV